MRVYCKTQSSPIDHVSRWNNHFKLPSFISCLIAFALLMFSAPAFAVFLTPLDKTPSRVLVCPEASCPQMREHPFSAGSRVVVYETKGSWARVTKFISSTQIATQFPGQFLPEKVAMWIPVKDLPETATNSPSIKKAINDEEEAKLQAKKLEEEKKKKAKRAFSFIPGRPAIPTASTRETVIAAAEVPKAEAPKVKVEAPKVETPTTDTPEAKEIEVAAAPQETASKVKHQSAVEAAIKKQAEVAATEPIKKVRAAEPIVEQVKEETQAKPKAEQAVETAKVEIETPETPAPETTLGEEAPDAPIPTKATRKVTEEVEPKEVKAEVETVKLEEPEAVVEEIKAEEPEVETDSFGNPIVSTPKKLTKELRDKRLSKLPSKPNAEFDLKSIIAMRHHGLQLIKKGECTNIIEGGRSLSLAGWIYLRCENDPTFRQFSVE